MKYFLQILFLLLTWFANVVNATPSFTKVVLPTYELSFSKTDNAKEEGVVKIGEQNYARSGILENSFSHKSTSRVNNALVGASHAGEREVVNGAGKIVVNSWNEAVTTVDNLILPKTSQLNNLFPNAKIGYRGSLSTGTKYSTGGPFDPTDWDVDAFIVSDNLAAQIGGGGFRNGRNIPSVANIADELETSFKNISGYRTELNKPFTFRVFTEAEFNSIVKPNGYKLFQ
jgi:hypothetical protein